MLPLTNRLREVGQELKDAPVYLAHYLLGLIALPFQQVEFTSLLILAILVGIAVTAIWGVIVFFAGYLFLRTFDAFTGGLYYIGRKRG